MTFRSSIVKDSKIFVFGVASLSSTVHGLLPPVVNLPNNVAGNRHSLSHKCQDNKPSEEDKEKSVLSTRLPCFALVTLKSGMHPTTAVHCPAKNEV